MPDEPDADAPLSTTPPEGMHWAVAYLREDIQDIRLELRDSRKDLEGRIEALRRELNTRFYWLVSLLLVSWLSTMSTILLKL